VLCLDIEGGHGGSSRSLLEVLSAMDRQRIEPSVICRRGGWIEDAYRDLGIECAVVPEMPRQTALHQMSRNIAVSLQFKLQLWPRSKAFRESLLNRAGDLDLLHLNHISLTSLAGWMKKKQPRLPLTMHIRTMPVRSGFADRQAKQAIAAIDRFAFITENEKNYLETMSGLTAPGDVIYNPVSAFDDGQAPHEAVSSDDRLKVACLSNFSYPRGIDRLIDIAKVTAEKTPGRVLFVVAGDMKLSGKLPPPLSDFAAKGGTLEDVVTKAGLADSFVFLGHVPNPEQVLAACDVLLKPTREYNPWGRDILEALAAGLPVASVGTYDTFVHTGKTGLLQAEFDAAGVAAWLDGFDRDREALKRIGDAGRDRVAALCDPAVAAEKLADLWSDTIREKAA